MPVLPGAFPAESDDKEFLDLEANGVGRVVAPEYIDTPTEHFLVLVTHIVKAVGMTLALAINGVLFIPFFLFAILPLVLKKQFGYCSRPSSSRLAASKRPMAKRDWNHDFFGRHSGCCGTGTVDQDADVSPLLLAADAGFDLVGFRSGKADSRSQSSSSGHSNSSSPPPPSAICTRCAARIHFERRNLATQYVKEAYCKTGRILRTREPEDAGPSAPPTILLSHTLPAADVLMMKGCNCGGGHDSAVASGLRLPGYASGMGSEERTIMKRAKTWENLQHAVPEDVDGGRQR